MKRDLIYENYFLFTKMENIPNLHLRCHILKTNVASLKLRIFANIQTLNK